MLRLATLITAALIMPAPVAADTVGTAMPPVSEDNPLIEQAEGKITIVTMSAPEGFVEAMHRADNAGVIDRIFGLEEDGAEKAEVAVFFVANWKQGVSLAEAVESKELAERYEMNAEEGFTFDSFKVDLKGGAFQVYTIAAGLTPYDVPADCYARLIVTSIYLADLTEDFQLRACAESFE